MCRFNQLDTAAKILLRDQLLSYAASIGGKNSFLKLLETIRKTTPNPLISKTALMRFPKGVMKWNKNIHRDNLTLLSTQMNARSETDQNLMAPKEHKSYKNVTNMLRALGTLTFTVIMNSGADGKGFEVKAFEMPDKKTTLLNPLFEILFFCPLNTTKKLLNFEEKENADSHEEE
jgi:hypothetical protein